MRTAVLRYITLVLAALPFALPSGARPADPPYVPAPENLAARAWFQDAKFGLFLHWGIYAVPGGEYQGRPVDVTSEWIMNGARLPVAEYEKFAAQLNPTAYDPAEWVGLARRAGMRYIVITSKHHDGFALWDSKVTDYDIVERAPYRRDVLKMLADECHRQGIALFFYYSHLDWHHPDYYPRGQTGHWSGRPDRGDFNRYLDFVDAQLTELLSGRYGRIAGIWFDGWWDQQVPKEERGGDPRRTRVAWRLRRTYDLIHRLQPHALVGNNHHVAPFEGEDFQMFEKDLPGENTTGFSADATIGALPLEMCETTNESWGYKRTDTAFKPLRTLVAYLAGAAGRNANLLLNVGPRPDGRFPPEAVAQLTQLGDWMAAHGESIHGTRGGPVPPQPWGVTTQKDGLVYVHVLDAEAAHGERLALPGLSGIRRATRLGTGAAVEVDSAAGELILPKASRDPIDTVLVLDLAR